MADEFIGMEIAVIVVTASIVLAGILIGLGRAFGYKKVEHFGIEELMQSIVNAAIIGSFAAIVELVALVSSSIVSETCSQGNVVVQLSCMLGSMKAGLFDVFQELLKTINMIGYYQTIGLDFGSFSLSPFVNLASVSDVLSGQLLNLNLVMMLVELNIQLTQFIGDNALALLFPVGLVLRTLFATRKVGGFLIALAIGLYLFYPTFILVFPSTAEELNASTMAMQNFTGNSYYATVPVIELNDNYAIAGKLDVLSGRCPEQNLSGTTNMSNLTACQQFWEDQNLTNLTRDQNLTLDFSGDLTYLTQSNNIAISKSILYAVIAPLFSLLITVVFVRELASLLGSEIGLKTVASI